MSTLTIPELVGAEARAHGLLLHHLTPAQRGTFLATGRFWHRGCYSWYVFVGDSVYQHQDIGPVYSWCLTVYESVPSYDRVLTRLLLLRCDEQAYLYTANAGGGCAPAWDNEIRQAFGSPPTAEC